MDEKEREALLRQLIGHIIDVTDLTEEAVEDTDISILENVPQIGRVRRYRMGKEWLKE